jgi:hypothetical protein
MIIAYIIVPDRLSDIKLEIFYDLLHSYQLDGSNFLCNIVLLEPTYLYGLIIFCKFSAYFLTLELLAIFTLAIVNGIQYIPAQFL